MKLLADDIVIRLETETIRLRPTLRAAMRLDRHFGGFDKLIASMYEGNLTTLVTVLRETSERPSSLESDLRFLADKPVAFSLEAIQAPLLAVVSAMIGYDPDAPESKPTKGKAQTFEELHIRLFETATGVLGWTPTDAWNATPNEIMAAAKGRVDFVTGILKAVFGTSEDGEPAYDPTNQELDRDGLAALKALATAGG